MAPTGEAYKVDWIWSNNSNVHVANHRDWFTTFTAFNSQIDSRGAILGVGDVSLDVKTNIHSSGNKTHRTVVLKDVVYVPTATCNILGGPILEQFGVVTGPNGGYLTDLQTGFKAGVLDGLKLWKLWLVGHRKGESSLDPDGLYWIYAHWNDGERQKWHAWNNTHAPEELTGVPNLAPSSRRQQQQTQSQSRSSTSMSEYTREEKAWLKQNFGGEFKFLRDYGLSIYKAEDREEGRAIARALMADDDDEVEVEEEEEEEEKEDEDNFLADLEADPSSHFADHYFSKAQLDWIKKHYRHSGNFLVIHGLKYYDDEDCQEGVAIAKAFMENDEGD